MCALVVAVERITEALSAFPEEIRADVSVIFTAHSLPERILEWNDPYPDELRSTVEAVMDGLGSQPHELAYQSAAMTADPWLGPDAGEVIERLHGEGRPGAVIAPIGFTSDHVEILYDIDVEYARLASDLNFELRRITMLNDHPRMMAGLARLIRERVRDAGWV